MSSAENPFPTAQPADAGVDSEVVLDFLRILRDRSMSLNSLLIYRSGRLVTQQFWWPYRADRPHMMHSATKSFVGTAAGFALAEKHLSLDDNVTSFFPDLSPRDATENLRAMTVRDLLTMRTGHRLGLSGKTWRLLDTSWVAEFLASEIPFPPGQRFTYSSATSHMLSAVVQLATGETVMNYLRPRLFEPLEFREHTWDTDPDGISSGGNGLSLRSIDLLKWGVLHLQDGVWEGRRVLPEGWVGDATTRHVDRPTATTWDGARFVPVAQDQAAAGYRRGYGYQIWLGPGGAYHASGMFGQQCYVFPRQDTVVAITGSIAGGRHRRLAELVYTKLAGAFDGLPGSPQADLRLGAQVARAACPPLIQPIPPAIHVDRTRYACADNEDGIKGIAFDRDETGLVVTLTDERGTHTVHCGLSYWLETDTTVTGWRLHHSYQPESMRVLARAYWTAPRTLVLDWYFVESPFHDTVTVTFSEDNTLRWLREANVNSGDTCRPVVVAHLVG